VCPFASATILVAPRSTRHACRAQHRQHDRPTGFFFNLFVLALSINVLGAR